MKHGIDLKERNKLEMLLVTQECRHQTGSIQWEMAQGTRHTTGPFLDYGTKAWVTGGPHNMQVLERLCKDTSLSKAMLFLQ